MHRIKNWKEYYATIGWWVEEWETTEQTAIREAKEETSLDVKLDWVFCKIVDERHDGIYYLAKDFVGEVELWWPEAERNNNHNHYDLQRIKKEEIKNIPLLPNEIKEKIIEYFTYKL